jgi:hypothetical protein
VLNALEKVIGKCLWTQLKTKTIESNVNQTGERDREKDREREREKVKEKGERVNDGRKQTI